jgi:hypothetical protein
LPGRFFVTQNPSLRCDHDHQPGIGTTIPSNDPRRVTEPTGG